MNPLRVFIGYDPRESEAYEVARDSVVRHASRPIWVGPVRLDKNEEWGLMTRQHEMRDGVMWDFESNAPQSTEFALSRFLVPLLAQEGAAIFMDGDTVCLRDPYEMFEAAEGKEAAVYVCKHENATYRSGITKMDGQVQTAYLRKNWSSVVLWNCSHPSNKRLTLTDINTRSGRWLHAFHWLENHEIGDLPMEWNWLVGVEEKPASPAIAHFTLGGPWLPQWRPSEYDDIWLDAKATMLGLRKGALRSTEIRASEVGKTRT